MLCVTHSFRASTIVYGKAKNNMYSVFYSFKNYVNQYIKVKY